MFADSDALLLPFDECSLDFVADVFCFLIQIWVVKFIVEYLFAGRVVCFVHMNGS